MQRRLGRTLFRATLYVGWVSVVTFVLLEVALRIGMSWNPNFYMGYNDLASHTVHYPWGDIRLNADGWPDDENGTKARPRVGYVGDSVLYGMGAGQGYRLTEVLDELHPQLEHVNFGVPGFEGAILKHKERNRRLVKEWELDQVVYMLNLNDIVPEPDARVRPSMAIKASVAMGWFNGRSYLYTALMTAFETYDAVNHGLRRRHEFQPKRRRHILLATANRIKTAAEGFRALGVPFTVAVLPYEIQVSDEAARYYQDYGIQWEPGFETGSTQEALLAELEGVQVIDLRWAFLDRTDPDASRASNTMCEHYVCTSGGKLDWNHLNRRGHADVGAYLAKHMTFVSTGRLATVEAP